jgi:hypothetical protein
MKSLTRRNKAEPKGTPRREKRIIVLMTSRIGTMQYLRYIPRKLPAGKLLVHNKVRPVKHIGLNGFRIWLQSPEDDPKLVVCKCGWAPHLGEHYRVIPKA